MLKIGIVGLPNVGKSTLFKALTKKQVEIANYPFTTIDPNVGVVAVPDGRLEKIAHLIQPEKHLPAVIEFVDIAGLVKGAHQGEGLGNQFLSHIYGMDAILFLVRCFKDENVISQSAGPENELTILKEELAKKDEEITERAKQKSDKPEEQIPALSQKSSIIVCNIKTDGENASPQKNFCDLSIDAKIELELSEMTPKEINELGVKPKLPELAKKAYQILNLITFYTIKGGKEVRAWPIKKGSIAPEAGEIVHSDFKEKFIRAEVIEWDKLIEADSWAKAREKGWIRTEGHDYEIKDGDVIEFKI